MDKLHELAQDPKKFDETEAALWEAVRKAQSLINELTDHIHLAAGDRKELYGRRRSWRRTHAEAFESLYILRNHGDAHIPSAGATPSELLSRENKAQITLAQARTAINEMEDVWSEIRWQRFFPWLSRDGHIHASIEGTTGACGISFTTDMRWRPDLSGLTVAEAVADLGEALCTFCFPGAPSYWKSKTLGQVKDERTSAERLAAKQAKDEARFIKALRPEQQFRGYSGDWVDTVFKCKEALRDEVMFRDYYGGGKHPSHPKAVVAAAKAAVILLAREAAKPGTGATQGEIAKIVKNAVDRNRRYAGARLDAEGNVIAE